MYVCMYIHTLLTKLKLFIILFIKMRTFFIGTPFVSYTRLQIKQTTFV